MLNGKSTYKVSTKQDKDADEKDTALTIVFDGCPESTVRALATQALIVKLQGGWRKNGIPSTLEVAMKDYAPGTRHSGLTPEQAKATVIAEAQADKAKRAALIAQLQAME
jgi:ketopantoate hydroxymethyltransferase